MEVKMINETEISETNTFPLYSNGKTLKPNLHGKFKTNSKLTVELCSKIQMEST